MAHMNQTTRHPKTWKMQLLHGERVDHGRAHRLVWDGVRRGRATSQARPGPAVMRYPCVLFVVGEDLCRAHVYTYTGARRRESPSSPISPTPSSYTVHIPYYYHYLTGSSAQWRTRWQRGAEDVPRMWCAQEGPQMPCHETHLTWGCVVSTALAPAGLSPPTDCFSLADAQTMDGYALLRVCVLCGMWCVLSALVQPPRRDPLYGEQPHIARRAYDVGSRSVSHRFIDS